MNTFLSSTFIIEHIIEEQDINAKRRIFECLPEFGQVSDANDTNIFVILDAQYENYTVAEIEDFCHKLSEANSTSLCHHEEAHGHCADSHCR